MGFWDAKYRDHPASSNTLRTASQVENAVEILKNVQKSKNKSLDSNRTSKKKSSITTRVELVRANPCDF
jgi:hypothetical protein